MPLIQTSHDSLPYIDPEPTPSQRTAAQALIDAELQPSPAGTTQQQEHPLLPPLSLAPPSTLMEHEYARLASANPPPPLTGISTSRYEALDAPSTSAPLATWRTALAQAYTAQTYLTARLAQLTKLEETGKEQWLAANEELVGMLAELEKELQAAREGIDRAALERRGAQEAVRGEMEGLERSWRDGVGRVLETEVAAEALRGRVLDERRLGGRA